MKNRGSYTSGHCIRNLWNESSASFINFIWNVQECKILFILRPFKIRFYRLSKWTIFQEENALLTQTLSMTLLVHAKVLLHVWSYDFYDMKTPSKPILRERSTHSIDKRSLTKYTNSKPKNTQSAILTENSSKTYFFPSFLFLNYKTEQKKEA